MPNSIKCKIKHLCHNGTLTERERDRILKALEQESCEDCISRETARRIVDSGRTRRHMIDMILATPPVIPQPKIGRWILQRIFPTKLYDEHLNEYECSECGRRIRCTESQLVNYPYCHCGAKMVEPQESEE